MLTLEQDRLVFRFPDLDKRAKFEIDFQRTLRLPDDGKTYPLPAGLGRFALRHTEDYADRLPLDTVERGGVILPMWQTEALWIDFSNWPLEWDLYCPVAVKIAAGKINAVSGERWRPGLHSDPQDYVVVPPQPWLDGFAVGLNLVRQFVAMPLGQDITYEEQVTGKAEWGGIQILVTPLKKRVWDQREREWQDAAKIRRSRGEDRIRYSIAPRKMGLTGGARLKQEIYADQFDVDDWDHEAATRVFVSIVHAKDWFSITGENNPNKPFTAQSYLAANLPWFEYCDIDQATLPGALSLAKLKSVGAYIKENAKNWLPGAGEVGHPRLVKLGSGGVEREPIDAPKGWDT